MAGVDAQDLYGLADELLEACVAALDTVPLFAPGFLGAPERSFVSPGEPAGDCCDPGQLTVHVSQILEMPTEPSGLGVGRRAGRHLRLNEVGLIVTVFRCVPGPEESLSQFIPPSMDTQQAAAQQLDADAWALWNHLFNRIGAGLLLERCQNVSMEGIRSLPPSGGCGGLVLVMRVALEGYEEVLP